MKIWGNGGWRAVKGISDRYLPWWRRLRREVTQRELFRREVSEAYRLYPGYGEAYFDSSRCVSVCYPVPLHLVVRLWHWFVLWWYRRIIRVDWWDTPFGLWKRQGESPYRVGYERGHQAAVFEMDVGIKEIDELKQFKTKAEEIERRAYQAGRQAAYDEIESQLEDTSRIQHRCIDELSELPTCKRQAE